MKNKIGLLPFYVLEKQQAPWSLEHIHARQMWSSGYTGDGAVVAVLDTGCAPHPHIKHSIIGGANFTGDNGGRINDYSDNNGHGTHISGIISASYNRRNGMTGVAPDAKLLVFKVLDKDGSGDITPILRAINAAINWRGHGGKRVNIIGMSFGTGKNYPELEKAVNLAAENDILVVTAAGNDGDGDGGNDEIIYPGYYNSVFQVGASGIDDKPADFSNSNPHLDMIAPGVDILSLSANGGYTVMSGTSMACPHVAGAAALIVSYYLKEYGTYPTRKQMIHHLIRSSRKIDYGRDRVGYGILDLMNEGI